MPYFTETKNGKGNSVKTRNSLDGAVAVLGIDAGKKDSDEFLTESIKVQLVKTKDGLITVNLFPTEIMSAVQVKLQIGKHRFSVANIPAKGKSIG